MHTNHEEMAINTHIKNDVQNYRDNEIIWANLASARDWSGFAAQRASEGTLPGIIDFHTAQSRRGSFSGTTLGFIFHYMLRLTLPTSHDTQEARYVFNIHQQVNNFYATPIVGRDGSLNYGNIRQSGGLAGSTTLPAEIDGWKTPRCWVSASCPDTGPEHAVWFGTWLFFPQFFSLLYLCFFFFYSLFFPWEHCRWSVITHHSTEEGFIMGLACWQDCCLDDKCSWLRALRGKLVAFFSPFRLQKHVLVAHISDAPGQTENN